MHVFNLFSVINENSFALQPKMFPSEHTNYSTFFIFLSFIISENVSFVTQFVDFQ